MPQPLVTTLASALLLSQLWLCATVLNRRMHEWYFLVSYFLLVSGPYLFQSATGSWAPGEFRVLWVALAHVFALTIPAMLAALPKGTERGWLTSTAGAFSLPFLWLVWFGDPGTLTRYLTQYYLLTGACVVASAMGLFTALYIWCYRNARLAAVPFAVGVYFLGDVAVNALYRRVEWVYDFNRLLQGVNHGWHLAVVGVVIWRMRGKG